MESARRGLHLAELHKAHLVGVDQLCSVGSQSYHGLYVVHAVAGNSVTQPAPHSLHSKGLMFVFEKKSCLEEEHLHALSLQVVACNWHSVSPADLNPLKLCTHCLQVEKHLRKNNLTVTFTDQMGQAKHSEAVTGEKEAKKLAFYLFWNVKPYFTR